MGVNEWIESLFECPPQNRLASLLLLALPLSRGKCVSIDWEYRVCLSKLLVLPSLREYASDPSWMEFSVLSSSVILARRAASGLTWRDLIDCFFVNRQNLIALLGFSILENLKNFIFVQNKRSYRLGGSCKSQNITGIFSHLPCYGPFVQGVKKEKGQCGSMWICFFCAVCQNGRGSVFLEGFLNLWDQFLVEGACFLFCAF